MSISVSVYIAISVDGFIARSDGAIDWLDTATTGQPEDEDCGFRAFMDTVDMLVMGRKTFEQVLTFGTWPYGTTPVIVLSSRPLTLGADVPATVSHSAEAPEALLARLETAGVRHVYVDGGATIQGFLARGLVDDVTVTVIPVVLGAGISPFRALPDDIRLRHRHTTVYGFGFVQTVYAVERG